MVIDERERPPYRPPERVKERRTHPISVLGVQCLACAVAVLLALLLRFVGGGAFVQLRDRFRDTLYQNDLMMVLASLWDGTPVDSSTADSDMTVSEDA